MGCFSSKEAEAKPAATLLLNLQETPMFESFGDSFNWARSQIVSHQTKIWNPTFNMISQTNLPYDCHEDAFTQCLIDTHPHSANCAKTYGCSSGTNFNIAKAWNVNQETVNHFG